MMLAQKLEKYNLQIERKGSARSPQIYCVEKTSGRKFAAWKTQEEAVDWAVNVLSQERSQWA
jgi:Uma2 family endonuclease